MRLVIISVLFLVFNLILVNASIQITPEKITFNNVLRDGYAETLLALSTDKGNFDVDFSIEGNLKDYFTIESNNILTQEQSLRTKIILKTPSNIQNGLYQNFLIITFTSKSSPEVTTSSSISKSIPIDVYITDTVIKQLEINNILIDDIRENQNLDIIIDWTNKGNVLIKPKIEVKILDLKNNLIKEREFETSLLPKQDNYNINLGRLNKNEYKAVIRVLLDDSLIQERTLNFFVLALNEKISKGILTSIENQDRSHIDDKTQIIGSFVNTGESELNAIMITEVYLNNNLIDTIESNNINIKTNQNIEINNLFIPKELGLYKFKNYIQYGNKISNTKESVLEVVPSNEPLQEIPLSTSPMFLILGMALVIFIFVRVNKAKRRKWQQKQ